LHYIFDFIKDLLTKYNIGKLKMIVDDDSVQSQQSLESGIMVMMAGNFSVDQGSPQHFSQTFLSHRPFASTLFCQSKR
jgi:hypothetical protein